MNVIVNGGTANSVSNSSRSGSYILVENGASVSGDVVNTGVLTATGDGQPSRTGITINNSTIDGAILNQGTINATAGPSASGINILNNALVIGGISNSGVISAGFSGIDVQALTFTGGITNSGMITAGDYGMGVGLNVSIFAGGITNSKSGTIFAPNGIFAGYSLSSFSGGINNAGLISAYGNGILVDGPTSVFCGGISNSGTISAGGNGILVDGGGGNPVSIFSGGITNSNTISAGGSGINIVDISTFAGGVSNGGTISGGVGINISSVAMFGTSSAGGGITNSGTILGDGSAAAVWISPVSTFLGGISNGGTISSSGGAGIYVGTVVTFTGGVTNSGAITANGTGAFRTGIVVSAVSSFAGNITNSAGGTISAVRDGIYVADISSFGGVISNAGNITAGGKGIVLGGATSAQVAPFVVSSFTGGITNSGTISAKTAGIYVASASTFANSVTNSGTIVSSAGSGIEIGGRPTANSATIAIETFAGGVSNSATISVGGNAIWIGGMATNGSSVTISTFSGGIGNAGTISAGGNGIFIGGDANGAGASVTISTFLDGISNSAGSTISAGGDGIFVGGSAAIHSTFAFSTFSGGISNSGTISAGGTGIRVLNVSTFLGGITNTAMITGSVAIAVTNAGAVSVFDSGLIDGTNGTAVDLSHTGPGNTFTLGPGCTIVGNVVGSSNDTFQLGGSGDGAFDLSAIGNQYTGFSTFNVVGGIWTVTGSTSQSWTITSDGTLLVDSSSTSIGNITDDGTFGFSQSDAYTFGGAISGTGLVEQLGPGTTTLTGNNGYAGVTIEAGTLELGSANAAGSGAMTFAANADAILKIDPGDIPTNTIDGFAGGDTIDLAGITVDRNGGAQLGADNVLQVSENGTIYDLQLDKSASFAGDFFHVAADAGGAGVAITEVADPILTIDSNSATPIGQTGAGDVGFTVTGLDTGDTGAVTFTDGDGNTVVVDVTASQPSYSANLAGLADGSITSSLTIANNADEPIAGNSVTLDQDKSPDVSIAITAGLDDDNHPTEGTPLTATLTITGPSGAQPSSPTTYTWFAAGSEVETSASANFTPVAADEGESISVTASYDDLGGNQVTATSTPTNTVLQIPPTVTATSPDVVADPNQAFASSALFSASDPDSAPILSYEVEDESTGTSNGFWALNGLVEPSGRMFTITAAELSELSFIAGSATNGSTSDTLEVAASDSGGFGAFATFTVTAAAHAPSDVAPIVSALIAQTVPESILQASGVFSGSVPQGESIVSYEVEDTDGDWVFDGTPVAANQIVDVSAAQLSELTLDTGFGNDTVTVRANDGTQWGSFTTFTITPAPNPGTAAGTSADVILRDGSDGVFEIYDLGENAILAAAPLGQVGLEWQVAGLGSFGGGDTSDMLLRNSNSGAFEVYDISNNTITFATSMGQVGLAWIVAGFGDFSGNAGETDMLMRNSNTGAFEIYDISNNAIASAAPMGQVGLEWSVAGFGDFSGNAGETDMLMRNSDTGAFEIYDVSNNQLTSAAPMGQVGLEWSVVGFGDFSGDANETDMLMRNGNTGAFEIYDISNNLITSAEPMGQVGLDWSVVGFGDFSGDVNETDMLMRNSNAGAFEVYDISNNAITLATSMGAVGMDWSVAGIAADPPGSAAAAEAQMVQAMASYAPSDGTFNTSEPTAEAATQSSSFPLFAAPAPHATSA